MSDFQTATPSIDTRDARRRVNYTLGMVLGVDDFDQEFAYLAGRDKAIVRDLIGYGTIEGLQISLDNEDAANGTRIGVSKGSAVNPQGQFIRVSEDQCAFINQWLAAQKTRLIKTRYDAAGNDKVVSVYLNLCYRECLTDSVPLPDQPCRTEDAALVPSRVRDDYELILSFDPPEQREEDELLRFIAFLNSLSVHDGGTSPSTSREDFARLILAYLPQDVNAEQPGVQPPAMPDTSNIRLPLAELPEFLRLAFRLWVTALRPARLGKGQDSAGKQPVEDCVLLARLNLALKDDTGGAQPGEDDRGKFSLDPQKKIIPDESRRPYVLHLRAIQEQLLYAQSRLRVPLGGDVTGQLDANEVQQLKHMRLAYSREAFPTNGQVLVARPTADAGMQWTPELPTTGVLSNTVVTETGFGQPSAGGTSNEYSRADHTHGTPTLPDLRGDVTGTLGSTSVAALKTIPVAYDPAAVSAGQVLTLEAIPGPAPDQPRFRWVAASQQGGTTTLIGDVSGATRSNVLTGIQNVKLNINRDTLKPYSILRYNGDVWTNVPYTPIVAAGYVTPLKDLSIAQSSVTFGDLRLAVTGTGQLAGTFTNYRRPDDKQWGYVVKALPFATNFEKGFLAVAFGGFTDQGFILYVRDITANQPVAADVLGSIRFMIEVTQVGVNPEFR